MDNRGLVERARDFATAAHRGVGQLRKYTGQPYEEHLRRVAAIVERNTSDPEMIAAAWLHDVVEDTPATIEQVEREFGPGVRELVDALTDVSRPQHGNRRERKARARGIPVHDSRNGSLQWRYGAGSTRSDDGYHQLGREGNCARLDYGQPRCE